jgi:hypothetical protein
MSLTDPYLKTTRAKVHLDALRHELDIFYETKPYAFIGQEDVENERFNVFIKLQETPDIISLIVGDFFYCLRSSLDQLVWSLAHITRPYPEGTQFPIQGHERADRFLQHTSGVPADAVFIIKSLQPYHAGDRDAIRKHLLWRLNAMCNLDKHRRIPTHSTVIDFKLPEDVAPHVRFENPGKMSMPLSLKGKVELHPSITYKIVFGDFHEGIECDFEGVERIYNYVTDDVLPRFARFFK